MSPSDREREYARRRHQAWQQRQSARAAKQRARRRRAALSVVGVVVAVAAISLAVWRIGFGSSGHDALAGAGTGTPKGVQCPAPTATASASPSPRASAPDPSVAAGRTWTGTITTSCGDIGISLDGAAAPHAVSSFVTLAQQGFFAGTPCHRLTTSGIYVLQCGDPTGTGTGGPGYTFGPVENAPADQVYPAGTIAMARAGGDPNSMGSQFFLVYQDSTIPADAAGGYTVFGRITSGLDVVKKVAGAGADDSNGSGDGAPNTPISIEQVTVQ